ncbi:PAC2 family protein [Cryobacterium sp. TMT1-19]|nr:PAC2 family protein [Cryobacterium sp. TMT1-19]
MDGAPCGAPRRKRFRTVTEANGFLNGRLLVVAFEGWNDAGEAATGAVGTLKDLLDVSPVAEIDPEIYFDYQFNRPTISAGGEDGRRKLEWPGAVLYGPTTPAEAGAPLADDAQLRVSGTNAGNIYLLLGTEPSRSWKGFAAEILDAALAADVGGIVFLGAMLADVPHTRPISIFVSSDNPQVRAELQVERSTYEGPVGILSVLAIAAEEVGIPTLSIWASVPHYVHNAPSPKAMLALIDKLEEIIDVVIPRGDLVSEADEWQSGIDTLAAEDDEMAAYIGQLEQARDTVDSPEASGEAIAQEFEKYLRKRGDGRDGPGEGRPPLDSPRQP